MGLRVGGAAASRDRVGSVHAWPLGGEFATFHTATEVALLAARKFAVGDRIPRLADDARPFSPRSAASRW